MLLNVFPAVSLRIVGTRGNKASDVSHHGAYHSAEVDGVRSAHVVLVFVHEVLRTDLQELQTRLKYPRLILHTWKQSHVSVYLQDNTATIDTALRALRT